MKLLLIVIGLILAAIVFYVVRTKPRKSESEAGTDTARRPSSASPIQPKQNDKLVIVKGVSYSDLKRVLSSFCTTYNKDAFQAQLRVTKLSQEEFAITFPYDINFEIYCYLINYIEYPMEIEWSPEVVGWTTTKSSETWITEKSANKKVMLFIPVDDAEHDNVYMTTSDNLCYKLGFAMGEEKQLLDSLKKPYISSNITFSDLTNKEFEEFQ